MGKTEVIAKNRRTKQEVGRNFILLKSETPLPNATPNAPQYLEYPSLNLSVIFSVILVS